jgi:hypothetical protein
MTNRTVKILGWGADESTATITAMLDGDTVFSGSVDLVEMANDNNTEQTAPTLFTFEIPMDFTGTKHMVITVDDAPVRFGQILANYTEIDNSAISYSTGPDEYADVSGFFIPGDIVQDPRTNITIDGKKQHADRAPGRGKWNGTWVWTVNPGSKFEHDLTITSLGLED